MIKIIQISDENFWGFNEVIDINDYSSFEEIGDFMKNQLIKFLKIHNLFNLTQKAYKLNLHNHYYKEYSDLYTAKEDIIYLCNGCHN